MTIVVIDTNVLRYALEAEKGLRNEEETRTSYRVLVGLLRGEETVVVFNPETLREYSRHINTLKVELGKRRVYPQSFSLLKIVMSKSRKVALQRHSFEISGEEIGRKDVHLLDSAKTGALTFGEKTAIVLTFAEDVYRAKEAKNGQGVVIKIVNMGNKKEVENLLASFVFRNSGDG